LNRPPTSWPIVATRLEKDAGQATHDDGKQLRVSALSGSGAVPSTAPARVTTSDADDAIRAAAKVAIDARDYSRARGLLDLLEAGTRGASVTPLAAVARSPNVTTPGRKTR
jgi:hypothetical protein